MLLELSLAGLALLLLAVLWDRKPSGMPPGPLEIPFIGQLPTLDVKGVRKLRDKYGSLVTKRAGNLRIVYVLDYTDAKDVFARHEFTPRPDFMQKMSLDNNVGVVFNSGPLWNHGRRFILRHLRALGTGNSRIEDAVLLEARNLVHHIAAYQGQPVTKLPCFEMAALNIIWQLIAGRRFSVDSEEIRSIYALFNSLRNASVGPYVLEVFPVLAWLPTILKNRLFGQQHLRDFLDSMRNLVKKSVTERQGIVDYDAPRDFINDYLQEMEEQGDQGDPKDRMRIEDLYQLMHDIFNGGSETMADMLRWVTFYMAKCPDIVARCQEEIDGVISPGEQVTLEHKQRLPYVEAFITEVFRHSSLVLFLIRSSATENASIRGYTLPKGTAITTCSFLIHRDPRYWTDPDQFIPDRFLDDSGNYKPQWDGFIPFGIGRRQCVGEALARAEFFLFSAALLQNFHVRVPDGARLQEEPVEVPSFRVPAVQPFVFTLRHPLEDGSIIS